MYVLAFLLCFCLQQPALALAQTIVYENGFADPASFELVVPANGLNVLSGNTTYNVFVINNQYTGGDVSIVGSECSPNAPLVIPFPDCPTQPGGMFGVPEYGDTTGSNLHVSCRQCVEQGVANPVYRACDKYLFLWCDAPENIFAQAATTFSTVGYSSCSMSFWWIGDMGRDKNSVQIHFGEIYYTADDGASWNFIKSMGGENTWQKVNPFAVPAGMVGQSSVRLGVRLKNDVAIGSQGGGVAPDPAFAIDAIQVTCGSTTPTPATSAPMTSATAALELRTTGAMSSISLASTSSEATTTAETALTTSLTSTAFTSSSSTSSSLSGSSIPAIAAASDETANEGELLVYLVVAAAVVACCFLLLCGAYFALRKKRSRQPHTVQPVDAMSEYAPMGISTSASESTPQTPSNAYGGNNYTPIHASYSTDSGMTPRPLALSSSERMRAAPLGDKQKRSDGWNIPFHELSLQEEIGRGAFGVVYYGAWRQTEIAAKQLGAAGGDAKMAAAVVAEAEIVKNLRPHPHVLLYLGVSTCDSISYLITEFMSGGSLDALLADTSFDMSAQLKLDVITGVAKGMEHLIGEGVIHRDLAPRNPRICDFGLSRVLENSDGGVTNTQMGPLRAMAPEAINSKVYNEKSEVWSFAVLCYECLTREQSYPGMLPVQIAGLVGQHKLRLTPPAEAGSLGVLMDQMLDWDPASRPTFSEICQFVCATRVDASGSFTS